jgi:hypothetical protein
LIAVKLLWVFYSDTRREKQKQARRDTEMDTESVKCTQSLVDDLVWHWQYTNDTAPHIQMILSNLLCRIEALYNCIPVDQTILSHQGETLCSIVNGNTSNESVSGPRPSILGLQTNGAIEQLYTLLEALHDKNWPCVSTLPLAALGDTLSSSGRVGWMNMTYCLLGRALVGQ